MKRMIVAMGLVVLAQAALAEDLDFSVLKYLAVQRDGRKKPLDTVAADTVQKLTGKRVFVDPESGRTMEPIDVLASMWLQTRDWGEVPIVLVNYKPLKEKLGLPADQKLFSYKQLATPQFQSLIEAVSLKDQNKQDLNRDDREASVVNQRLRTLIDAVGPEAFAVVPHPRDPKGAWVPVTEAVQYYGAEKEDELQKSFQNLGAAYMQRDPSAFAAASRELRTLLRALGPTAYPSPAALRREVHYNSFHPFQKAGMLYALAFAVVLSTFAFRGSDIPVATGRGKNAAPTYWLGIAAFVAGLTVHGWAFYLRIMISGRPPVTNMFESVVWVSFGAALFALILELIYRQRYYVVAVAPLSVVMLVLADQFPAVLDPSIGPLAPVLRDNFWLTVHVPTITLGYAAMAVALGVGHIALGYYIFSPSATATIGRLENYVYLAMQIGLLLLAAGTILGGIWAHYAWGRFWGWDPKETWALIAILSYLVPLHGRLAGWMSNFALCVASVLCFQTILMAWYGVNFVLGKGLHSYGFGVGGFEYALGFAGLELAFVGLAAWRRSRAIATGRVPEPELVTR